VLPCDGSSTFSLPLSFDEIILRFVRKQGSRSAKRIVNSAIDVPAGGSRTYAFDLYSKLVEAFPMLGVGAMSETVWDKLVKKLQQMIGEVERRTQQKETENLAGAGDGR
jgi:hypothetical protein